MTRVYVYLGVAALVLGLTWFGLRQYGNARVAESKQEQAVEVVSSAVVAQKQAVKADVAQTAERALEAQRVRSAVISYREKTQEVRDAVADADARDRARLGLYLDAARCINAGAKCSGELSDAVPATAGAR